MCALFVCAVGTIGMNSAVCDAINMPDPTNPGCMPVGDPSVVLTLTTEDGQILPTGQITFTFNNAGPFTGSCQNGCEDVPIAFDGFGQFNIFVTSPGFESRTLLVDVGSSDDCNPITQTRIVVMEEDQTVGAIRGAWRANTVFGTIDVRFGNDGSAIGAILYDRVAGGDGNIYVSYNGNPIRGVAGQQTAIESVASPTRNGDVFNFDGTTLGVPVGFFDAQFTQDFASLVGVQPGAVNQGLGVTYVRLGDIPVPLQDPS